jgi:tetratricopeptide (TPR) repeat protein
MHFLINLWARGIPMRLIAAAGVIMALGLDSTPLAFAAALTTAQSAADSGQYATAAAAYHEAFDYAPWNTEYLVAALELEIQGQLYDEAELDLEKLAGIRPLTSKERVWLGQIYAARGELDRALEVWELALTNGSLDPETLSTLTSYYVERGQWRQGRHTER